jgi:murein L,D-transpeptidase YcbB/YkuD
MHPLYGQLRTAFLTQPQPAVRYRLLTNLRRARELPSYGGRHVLVNAAAQRLYMYENGEVVDHMRVVAGKPAQPTPMMAALIRFTSVNPYWNVPTDLAASNLAPNVLKNGLGYLKQKGYQVIDGGGDNARIVNPASIDWKAVAAGRKEIYMRQLPGPANSMGRMKFMFPNKEGIYLHDTPRDELFDEAARLLSAGCVRLQDADRLAKWLYGRPLKAQGRAPEQKVPLPQPVPVLLTYLTAVPSGTGVAYFDDHYGWDRTALAQR